MNNPAFNPAFIVALVIGTAMLLSVCWVYIKNQSFGLGGSLLSMLAVILIGMSVWKEMQFSIGKDGIKAHLAQVAFVAATIAVGEGGISAKATQTLEKTLEFKMDKGAQSLEVFLGPIGPNGTFDPEKIQEIKQCWKKTGIPEDTFFVDFIFEPVFETKRVEVSDCLKHD